MNTQRLNPALLSSMLETINCEPMGKKIMHAKGEVYTFLLQSLTITQLQILKQELVSVGGDLATPREAILCEPKSYNALLIATKSQLLRVIDKCAMQPFGLKALAKTLASHLNAKQYKPRLMAIINLTPDSFHADSRHSPQEAIAKIQNLIAMQAPLIDIGAASSRPGSELIDYKVEIERLSEVCAYIKHHQLYKHTTFSIDTYNPQTADFALDSGFRIVNDVSGLADEKMFEVIGAFGADVVLMHSKGTPKNMAQLTEYSDLFGEIDMFFERKIAKLRDCGAGEIILDIGFGFAKSITQNLSLIQHLSHFKHFGLELLVGASNKSIIGAITHQDNTANRLSGTLSLHLLALQNGASILRVHNYQEHLDMLRVYEALSQEISSTKEY